MLNASYKSQPLSQGNNTGHISSVPVYREVFRDPSTWCYLGIYRTFRSRNEGSLSLKQGINSITRIAFPYSVPSYLSVPVVKINFSCYHHWFALVIKYVRGTFHYLYIKEGITQGDPLVVILLNRNCFIDMGSTYGILRCDTTLVHQ